MTERAELIKRSTSGENVVKNYGAVDREQDRENEDLERPPKCLCTRRDCILVIVLSILISVAIVTSLAVGIPKIQEKHANSMAQLRLASSDVATVQVSSDGLDPLNSSRVSVQKRAAVSADHPICADVGRSILAKNGSASDAAIAILVCLEVVHPQHAGIGGGFLMTLYDGVERVAIDARESAPSNCDVNATFPLTGGRGVGLPLALKGYWQVHRRFGRLPWKDLFTPSIRLSLSGFQVDASLATALFKEEKSIMAGNLRQLFTNNATGQILKEGDFMRRPQFSRTLQIIADKGVEPFYNGSLGRQLVTDVRSAGGALKMEDLMGAKVIAKKPLEINLKNGDLKILTQPLPSIGSDLIFLLNLFETFNNSNQSWVTIYQRLVESYKFAFGQKSLLGDDKFVNVSRAVEKQMSRDFAFNISKLIVDDQTFESDYYLGGEIPVTDSGTTHVSVVDSLGQAVSITSTINTLFGAKFRSPSLDVILNDELNDFNADKRSANKMECGKRPISSMLPSLIINKTDHVVLVIGGAGGSAILTSVSHVLLHFLYLNRTLPSSIESKRLYHQLIPNLLRAEKGFPPDILQSLKSIGHNLSDIPPPESHVNAIARQNDGSWLAVSDPRIPSATSGL